MGSKFLFPLLTLYLIGNVAAQQFRMGPSDMYNDLLQNYFDSPENDELSNAFPNIMAFNWSSIDLKSLKAVSSRCSKDIEQIMGSRLPYARQCKHFKSNSLTFD